MTIETTKQPYELLVRWREGKISGAHVGFELTTVEDGVVLSTTPLPVMAVDVGHGVGFPLTDILAQVQTDALIGRDVAMADLATEQAAHEATKTSLAAVKTELAQLEAVEAAP